MFSILVNSYFQFSFILKVIFVCGQNKSSYCDLNDTKLNAVNLMFLKIGHLLKIVKK